MIATLAAKCKYDPLMWAEVAWEWGQGELKGKDIRYWQADIMDQIAKHLDNPETRYQPLKITVASGHGIGKSATMGMVSNWAMSCWEGARVVITANTEGQLSTKTSPEIGKWFNSSLSAPLFEVNTLSIRAKQDSEAVPWSMDFTPWSEHNTEAFAGLHNEGRIIVLLMDEASGIAAKIWEVAEGALTDENTVILWIAFGNPTQNTGEFKNTFKRGSEWIKRQICSLDVEGTNKKYLRGLVEKYGWNSDRVKVRVRGMFPSSSNRQLISTLAVDEAYGRHLPKASYEFAPVILTCDPAWTGDDDLIISKRQGLFFEILETIPKNDNDVLIANKIARYEDKYQADAVFIDLGYGTGIKSAGSTMGREWELVNFADAATTKGHFNKRAEMWDAIPEWLEEGGTIPEDQELHDDLTSVETLPTMNGAIKLLSKEDMKTKGLPSPNKGDSLALSFARPVTKKDRSMMVVAQQRRSAARDKYTDENGNYDPYA